MSRRLGVGAYLLSAAALLLLSWPVERHIQTLREQKNADGYSLACFAPSGQRPTVEALATSCLGGFRGIIADFLWLKAIKAKEERRHYEVVVLLDAILEMQPHFISVWELQANGLVFDFGSTVINYDPEEAYKWIRRGIEILEEGARKNPTSYRLHFYMAHYYIRKLSPLSSDKKTWKRLLAEWHRQRCKEAIRTHKIASDIAKKAGKSPPELILPETDSLLGLEKAREHYLLAASKPDIPLGRKLLCERMAIKCRLVAGRWREGEQEWALLWKRLNTDGTEEARFFGKDSPGYKHHQRLFREFMRAYLVSEFLKNGRSGALSVFARMKSRNLGAQATFVDEIKREIFNMVMLSRNEARARRIYKALKADGSVKKSFKEVLAEGFKK
jgi:hypothetical protein